MADQINDCQGEGPEFVERAELSRLRSELEEAREIIRTLADMEPSSLVEPGSDDDRYRRSQPVSDISKCADSFCPSKDHCHRFTAPASKVWQSWGDFQRKGEPCCDHYWPAVEPVTEKQDG